MKHFSGVWILGEQRHGKVLTITHELLNRGRSLADKRQVPLTAIILGKAAPDDLDELIKRGADQVIIMEAEKLSTFLPEPYTQAMGHLIHTHKPEIIIAGATSTGRTLMPLLAIKFHAGLTADCTGLDIEEETGNLLQTRPAIGGNIMATIKSPAHRPQMATVRPKSTRPAAYDAGRTGTIIKEEMEGSALTSRVKLLKFTKSAEETANIQEADVIIAGGRGLKKGDNFQLINELAGLLDG
ncbi:MAG: electron transfer flavoprotein subunit alpha, partial [Xanthomonadaceae bacterium]|nr:electron transfer flavoprotein subunit alpha [Xanthomonadaceae bacterium]